MQKTIQSPTNCFSSRRYTQPESDNSLSENKLYWVPRVHVSDLAKQMKIPEEDLAELDAEIDPFVTYRRPQPGSIHYLHVEKKTLNEKRSKSRLVSRNDENMSSMGSKMSFSDRKKITSRLTSDLSLPNTHKIKTAQSPAEKPIQATPTKEAELKVIKSRNNLSGLNLPFPVAM